MAVINNQILQCMTKFMTDSLLFKMPGHKPDKTFIFGSCTARNVIAKDQMKLTLLQVPTGLLLPLLGEMQSVHREKLYSA
jgi:hypothetical protein